MGGHSPPSCIWSGMHKLAFCEINELTGWLFNFFLLHSRTPYFGTAESPYIIFCAALKTQSETIPTALRILPQSVLLTLEAVPTTILSTSMNAFLFERRGSKIMQMKSSGY